MVSLSAYHDVLPLGKVWTCLRNVLDRGGAQISATARQAGKDALAHAGSGFNMVAIETGDSGALKRTADVAIKAIELNCADWHDTVTG